MEPLDLGDRQLWPDGSITVKPELVARYLTKLAPLGLQAKLFVTELTDELRQFNAFSDSPLVVKERTEPGLFPPGWELPDRYKYLPLDEYLLGLTERIDHDELYDRRVERLGQEIWLFKTLELEDILRALIYVVETLEAKGAVWGVGRGSSCSSYLLYLLGLHEVDPVRYGIEITDFLREGYTDGQKHQNREG